LSLKTRDWSRALQIVAKHERGDAKPEPKPRGVPLTDAITSYLADGRARNLAESTVKSYATTLERLRSFAGDVPVREITVDLLRRWRSARQAKPATQAKEIETLRNFSTFCVNHGWLPDNPAKRIKAPHRDETPTMPFEQEEVLAIIHACSQLQNNNPIGLERARLRARALVLLLLYSGLRISDAVALERARVDMMTGRLLIRMMKTRTPLYVTLSPDALQALAAIPVEGPYFLWSGRGKVTAAIGSARRTIDAVLRVAKVEGHPHRFRDTFSVALLAAGEDLRTVQLLLGHQSIKTTEKHYAPYVASFQRQLDSAVRKLDFTTSAPVAMNADNDALRNPQHGLRVLPAPKRRLRS
jgi:site-specific recombinase XerD